MSPNIFTWGHIVKIEWLVAEVTAVGSIDNAERAIFGVIDQVIFVAGEPLCGVGTPS